MDGDRFDVHRDGRVAMRQAYEWTCERCGRDNFERCVVLDMSEKDLDLFVSKAGLRVDNGCVAGSFISYPDTVTCKWCTSSFKTENFDAKDLDQ